MTWRFLTLSVDAVLSSAGYKTKKCEKKIRTFGIWGMIFDRTRAEIDDDFIRLWMPCDLKFKQFHDLFELKRIRSLDKRDKTSKKK